MATRLFHMSDVHFGVEDRSALAQIERAIVEERPDALICTGDLTQRATRAQYTAAAQWFGQFDIPVWVDPGNHDMPYFNLWERFRHPYRRFNQLREAIAIPAFETDDVILVPLKTTVRSQSRWPWSDGVVTSKALEATKAHLSKFKGDPRWVIVTAHHPLHGPIPGGASDTIGGITAFKTLCQSGMDAILSGHIHKPFNERRSEGTASAQVIGAGTVSTRLRHGAPPSYNVLTCEGGPGRQSRIAVETRILAPEGGSDIR